MALIDMKKFVVVLALAIFAGACAQKTVRVETPEQPYLTVSSEEQRAVLERAEEIERERAEKRAKATLEKQDTPAMRQARRELERERKEKEKAEKDARKTNEMASVIGCTDTQVLTNRVEQKPSIFSISAEVTLVNTSDIPWQVRTESRRHGHIVRDICVGGSLGLHFSRSAWQDFIDTSFRTSGNRRNVWENILLVAVAAPVTNERGEVKVPRPQTFRIRLNRRTGQVSTTGLFRIKGNYLPKAPRVRSSRTTTP